MPLFSRKCYSTARLVGKTAIITGCNTGIGKETAMDFYKRGAKVIMACRNLEKAEEAKSDIERRCAGEGGEGGERGELRVAQCDLSSLQSVREFAERVVASEPRVAILVNNAGVMMCPRALTLDGHETQFATNHLGHFLLTVLLLPVLHAGRPARVVTLSSAAHARGVIHFDDLNFETRPYNAFEAYAQSKLANVMFSRELAAKLKERGICGVHTYCLHPGVIRTELGRHLDRVLFPGARLIIKYLTYPFFKSPLQGAQTTIYCAVDEQCAQQTGLYYSDCAVADVGAQALDEDVSRRLWEVSAALVGLKDYDPFTHITNTLT